LYEGFFILFLSLYCFYRSLISLACVHNSCQSDSLFLLLADDKPVLVLTHGDLLSLSDRARVRVYLGELLGIPPTEQIFDIPGSLSTYVTIPFIEHSFMSLS
jgi:hypothetical protein